MGAFQRRGKPEQSAGDQRQGEYVSKNSQVRGHVKNHRAIFGGQGLRGHDH